MTADRRAQKIVVAGASSLLGCEVKSLLEESSLAGWDLRLVDEEDVAGTLTEAGGEATLIQRIEEDTFQGARFAFLTGSRDFAEQCIGPAEQAGATIIDFSRATLRDPDATPWFPKIEVLTSKRVRKDGKAYSVFSAGGTAVASLTLALQRAGLQRLVTVLFQPVSEAGRAGIEELETQTSQLLSFQSVGEQVFGAQAAFNLLPCYGTETRQDLNSKLLLIRAEVSAAVGDADLDARVAMNLVHAPVFYGAVFSACAVVDPNVDVARLKDLCQDAGFTFVANEKPGPSNVSVAGETTVLLRDPARDAVAGGSWWFWGAADNLRFPAWNGCQLAEWLAA